jgi:ferredoxin
MDGRRSFLGWFWRLTRGTAMGAAGLWAATGLRARLVQAAAAPPGQHPLRPPGALPEPDFRRACTRCYLCGEVCTAQAIRFPSRIVGAQPVRDRIPGTTVDLAIEAPVWQGDDTPYVLPWERSCYLCMQCGEACPTGALRPIPSDRATVGREVRMGMARIDRKVCLPWTRVSWCGACFTACPYRQEAITVDHQNRPFIHAAHCVGCGICVEVYPIRHKAIAVVPPFVPDRGYVRPE